MQSARRVLAPVVLIALTTAVSACGDTDPEPSESAPESAPESVPVTAGDVEPAAEPAGTSAEPLFPDVLDATAAPAGDTWTFSATLSSPYDTPDRYADAWRVIGPDGTVYGIRELTHDHQNEQPFTRTLSGVVIPDTVGAVTVQGRDQLSGWGGATVEVALDAD